MTTRMVWSEHTKQGVESIEHDKVFRFQGVELARGEPGVHAWHKKSGAI